ncbi:TPA: MbeD family mobilization/exclusion protein [Escherichia coli]|nr:MbeD family mobilization/exclusion protein [Escherichia coli]HDP8162823.1 MbeD family mobilization/exclusion protein [Escherichia coli]HDP8247383.1 MbeD family mobilization/exclusion protein [Escherichia coli]HDP8287287.1 MbeD family mobilization/exclusion protein [Escherichia coli]
MTELETHLLNALEQLQQDYMQRLSEWESAFVDAKWHLNRSQFGIRIDHDLASISDHSLASQSITIWHASDH